MCLDASLVRESEVQWNAYGILFAVRARRRKSGEQVFHHGACVLGSSHGRLSVMDCVPTPLGMQMYGMQEQDPIDH